MDRGAWQVAALGAAKSHTRLKRLSMHAATTEMSALFMTERSWLPHSLVPSNSAAIWYFFNSVDLEIIFRVVTFLSVVLGKRCLEPSCLALE